MDDTWKYISGAITFVFVKTIGAFVFLFHRQTKIKEDAIVIQGKTERLQIDVAKHELEITDLGKTLAGVDTTTKLILQKVDAMEKKA